MLLISKPTRILANHRIGAVLDGLFVSGGFFGIAHVPALRDLLYTGAILVVATTLTVGIGLILAR